MNHIYNFNNYIKENIEHILSGVVLILDNKILLVHPKKFKNRPDKWSIPKGHVEQYLSDLQSALLELAEETKIQLPTNKLSNIKKETISYTKNNITKILHYYVVDIGRNEIHFKLYNNMILRYFLDKEEIEEAGFFNKSEAQDLIETHQKELLKYIN